MLSTKQRNVFTSQHVSINSQERSQDYLFLIHLHPNMYLLIQKQRVKVQLTGEHLHPNMYLLIRIFNTALFTATIIYIPTCIY